MGVLGGTKEWKNAYTIRGHSAITKKKNARLTTKYIWT